MKYIYKAAPQFWRSYQKLGIAQQALAKEVFKIFRENPFDPSLRTHKIHFLSAKYGRTIYSATIDSDLKAVFYVEGNVVKSVDIGTHDVYQ